jgi:hypothetical protein
MRSSRWLCRVFGIAATSSLVVAVLGGCSTSPSGSVPQPQGAGAVASQSTGGTTSPSASAVTPSSPHASTSASAGAASPSGSAAAPSPSPSYSSSYMSQTSVLSGVISGLHFLPVYNSPDSCTIDYGTLTGRVSSGTYFGHSAGSHLVSVPVAFSNTNMNMNIVKGFENAAKSGRTVTVIAIDGPCGNHEEIIKGTAGPSA